MRIGVISDTHITGGTSRLPQQVLDEFKNVDMVLHAGDLVEMGTLEQLKSVCPQVKAVRGNMDSEEVKKALPEREVFCAGRFKIVLVHGWGAPANLVTQLEAAFKNDKPDIVVFGHSHSPFNQTVCGTLYFNPGSPTDKVFSSHNSYGIINIGDKIEARIIKL